MMEQSDDSRSSGSLRFSDGAFTKEHRKAYNRPSTAQQAVLSAIRQAIMTRELKPGQWIRQIDIASQLGVSSVPVREALSTLAAEGQVVYERHRGYKVVELSSGQLEEIYLARRLLENEATGRAVPKVDVKLARLLHDSVAQMEHAAAIDDILKYAEANRSFHFLLFEQAGLPRILNMIKVLWQNSEAYRSLIAVPTWYQWAQEDHRKILEACKARDVAGVIAAQDEHRQKALVKIIDLLRRSGA